jgi:hypothetical protein
MDPQNTIKQIIERKSIFLVVVVLLIAFIIGTVLYGNYSSKMVNLQNKIQQNTQKITLISPYQKSKEDVDKIIDSSGQTLTGDALISQISDYANPNHIEIINASPGEVQNQSFSTITTFRLNVRAKSFKDLVSFIFAIERSVYLLKVDSLTLTIDNPAQGSLNCDININSVQIKK